MLKITDDAKERLHSLLVIRGGAEVSLRLVQSPSQGLGLVIDKESKNDQVIEHNGVKILVVGEDVMPFVNNITIDIKREDSNCTLVINQN